MRKHRSAYPRNLGEVFLLFAARRDSWDAFPKTEGGAIMSPEGKAGPTNTSEGGTRWKKS